MSNLIRYKETCVDCYKSVSVDAKSESEAHSLMKKYRGYVVYKRSGGLILRYEPCSKDYQGGTDA